MLRGAMCNEVSRKVFAGAIQLLGLAVLYGANIGCGDYGTKEITKDPSYGDFTAVVGTWKTKAELWLQEINGHLYLVTTNEHYHAPTRDLQAVPVGTEIRIQHLIRDRTVERDLLYATGTLTSGPYAGKGMRLDDLLFAPNGFMHLTVDTSTQPASALGKQWAVAPDKLGK